MSTSNPSNKNKKKAKFVRQKKPKNSTNEAMEIKLLNSKIANPSFFDTTTISHFNQLPISSKTISALENANFVKLTQIQKLAIPLALAGKDLLAAAKTGSGKTLAFVIPILEALYRSSWTQMDGLGALIISPTRELALQIFQVLRQVGATHSFSAGLLIGGKDLNSEKLRVCKMNILVATPGRLLQHMDQTPDFTCDNLQFLVLDEADRILDSGFEKTLNAIIQNLPKQRNTLLFSATQTKSVKDLARLSLKNPEYVSVHEKAESSTPVNLVQNYLVCELQHKLEILLSFLKTHQKMKIIVFLSSCKQVKFVHETFCKMQPGIVLMALHGKQSQDKRTAIFDQFCKKKSVCLFATDIAARGLDFPAVDWVIQVDCPENADTYIHRVGRTARYENSGNALMFLLPSEEAGMVELLEKKRVPINKTRINPEKVSLGIVQRMLTGYCTQDPDIKYLAQKTFTTYVKSVHTKSLKNIFQVSSLPLQAYAESLGLPMIPKMKSVLSKSNKNAPFNQPINIDSDKDEGDDKQQLSKVQKLFKKKNQSVLTSHYQNLINDVNVLDPSQSITVEDDDEDDFLKIKRTDHDIDESLLKDPVRILNRRQQQREKAKNLKNIGTGKKFKFDEDGNPLLAYKLETLDEYESRLKTTENQADVLQKVAESHTKDQSDLLAQADIKDKADEKQRIKERKKEKKMKERQLRRDEGGMEVSVTCAPPNDDTESEYSSDDGESVDEMDEVHEIDLDEDVVEQEPPISLKRKKTKVEETLVKAKKKSKIGDLKDKSLEEIALELLK